MITLKKGEVGNSNSEPKLNIGLLQRSQPIKVVAQKEGDSKSTSEVGISDIWDQKGPWEDSG